MGREADLKKEKTAAKAMSKKQIRARARRAGGLDTLHEAEKRALMGKPMEEWDLEELARGRPRSPSGDFRGPKPKWITAEMHEKSIERFKELVRTDMRSATTVALAKIVELIEDDNEDDRGRPTVPAAVKADLSKFLIEHLIGKPKQPIEGDISVRLQGILGAALVVKTELPSYSPTSQSRDIIDAEVEEDEDD